LSRGRRFDNARGAFASVIGIEIVSGSGTSIYTPPTGTWSGNNLGSITLFTAFANGTVSTNTLSIIELVLLAFSTGTPQPWS